MNYLIRELKQDENKVLDTFLYEAIFIPEGVSAPPKDIINQPDLQVYVKDFGKNKGDLCLVAQVSDKIVGAVWVLEFRFVEGTIKLYADDIIYIETELHKNVFYTEKGTFQIYKKLDELENEFKDMGFVRAHLSFLVNMRYITKISGYVMTLTTGKKIPVHKARYAQVKREYMLYKGEE